MTSYFIVQILNMYLGNPSGVAVFRYLFSACRCLPINRLQPGLSCVYIPTFAVYSEFRGSIRSVVRQKKIETRLLPPLIVI